MEVKILRGLTSEIFKNINNPRVNFLIKIITQNQMLQLKQIIFQSRNITQPPMEINFS